MQWSLSFLLGWAAALSAQPVPAQTSLPSTAPTSLAPEAEAPAGLAQPRPKPATAAEISYAEGKLVIAADNSSLNQILREIQRKTGMKITGGVSEERVFGKYGPGTLSEVLTALLDGTGSNVLLVGADQTSPAELILTPRQGSASPPTPSALAVENPEPVRRPEPMPPPAVQPAFRPFRGGAIPSAATPIGPPPSTADGTMATSPVPFPDPSATPPQVVSPPVSNGGSADPAASSTGTTAATSNADNPQSPNGTKTPQQIYQQLIRMQQQQQQQTNPK
jgi:hypothetical protein